MIELIAYQQSSNLVPRAFLINEEFQRGEGPGKLWSRVRQILQKSWSICLRAGFLEINTGGAIKSSRQDDGGLLAQVTYILLVFTVISL